ncbi:alpha/beta fold hydrolase [Streptomyces sp. NPDC059717]|uniref:alpha/beta fold hydrolase n=1 Tax=Streptomyces sp. NPDC059717 TaxID=3346922 RepID=UPI0036739FF9
MSIVESGSSKPIMVVETMTHIAEVNRSACSANSVAHRPTSGAMMPDITQSREEWIAGGSRRRLPGFPHVVFVRHDGPSTGVPVTLLHGFPTSSHDWAAVVPQLVCAGFRVTTADFVGFGESDKPYPHAYSIPEQADLVEAVWEVDGHDTSAVVTHDYAVSVAQELLARTPDRVTCMTWLNGGIWPDLHHPIPEQNLLAGPAGAELAEQMDEEKFISFIDRLIGERPLPVAMLHDMWLGARARDGLRVLPALLHYMEERRRSAARWTGAVHDYEGPQQFIWGPEDPISGAHVIPRIREAVPEARLAVLDQEPAVGHFPQVESPERVGPLLTGWIRENS